MKLRGYNYRGRIMCQIAYANGISRTSYHPVGDLLVREGRRKFWQIMKKHGIQQDTFTGGKNPENAK